MVTRALRGRCTGADDPDVTLPAWLTARVPRAAARAAALMLSACAVVLALYVLFGPERDVRLIREMAWFSVVGLLVVAAGYRFLPADRLDRAGAFLWLPVVGVVLLAYLNVLSGTTSSGAQAFLGFAVLYAGVYLRAGAVLVATAAALAMDGVMLFAAAPPDVALADLMFFGALLIAMGIVLVRTANAQERMLAALRRQAGVDALTGLVTRRVLDKALDTALTVDPTVDGTALLVMDVDEFKSINDAHGHPVGDDALVHLAAVIQGRIRASDAVIGRLGGDEIAVLLTDCSPEVAARRSEDILDAVRAAPLQLTDGTLLALSVSIGVAHAPRHATGLRALYAAADAALYEAKRGGRDRVAIASPAV